MSANQSHSEISKLLEMNGEEMQRENNTDINTSINKKKNKD